MNPGTGKRKGVEMDINMNAVYKSVEEAVRRLFGEDVFVRSSVSLSGGDINVAAMLELTNGQKVFIKSNKSKGIDFFKAEVQGLSAINSTNTISVPKVLGLGVDSDMGAFLILEYVETVRKTKGYWGIFADELAAMHKADTSKYLTHGRYGFLNDNYIGFRNQINTAYDSWVDFFRECRLRPGFEGAESYFDTGMKKSINKLIDRLDKWLIEPDRPSLLHGDLWGGNVITGNDGKAWLIDPAVYVGHMEADLAMTELFGGFSGEFYSEYRTSGLISEGYEDRRKIYNLYHLLNHLISFGRSYYGAVANTVKYYAG